MGQGLQAPVNPLYIAHFLRCGDCFQDFPARQGTEVGVNLLGTMPAAEQAGVVVVGAVGILLAGESLLYAGRKVLWRDRLGVDPKTGAADPCSLAVEVFVRDGSQAGRPQRMGGRLLFWTAFEGGEFQLGG